MKSWAKQKGFTIVELLIVIVVIAILAAVTIVAYNGVQDRARTSKINNDLSLMYKAILSARLNSGEQALRYVTGSTGTAGGCANLASGTNLSALDKTSHPCWTQYTAALQTISNASNVDITSLVDPWGRPYFIDENEKEGANQCGNGKDIMGSYSQPFVTGWSPAIQKVIPYITPSC